MNVLHSLGPECVHFEGGPAGTLAVEGAAAGTPAVEGDAADTLAVEGAAGTPAGIPADTEVGTPLVQGP